METLLDRFLRYITFDTTANGTADCVPSSPGQMLLAQQLEQELRALGLQQVEVDAHAYVTATLPANTSDAVPCIGLLAHLDTACEITGAGVKARVIAQYDGTDIALNPHRLLSPAQFPELLQQRGKTLVVTDGTTLLGADDKSGIAVIMSVLAHLTTHPNVIHGPVKVAFVPDEEIGHGAQLLDIARFGADFAYTVDGSGCGTIEYENFNAAMATVTISGVSIHPGHAKDRMCNAVLMGQALLDMLPPAEIPSRTEDRQGFFHVTHFCGDVSEAHIELIIRDHDRTAFEARKTLVCDAVDTLNARYATVLAPQRFNLDMHDQYFNMLEKMIPHIHVVDTAVEAIRASDLTPIIEPIRGGTDGAQLSWRGLPTPNLFAGDYNGHGPYEFAVVEDMEKSAEVVLRILAAYANPQHPARQKA